MCFYQLYNNSRESIAIKGGSSCKRRHRGTHSVRVEGRLVGGQRGEVGGHAGCRGRVRVRRAVHGQRHAGRQPLVVKKLVLTRANGLARDGVLEYRSPGVAAAAGGGGRARTRRAARAARP